LTFAKRNRALHPQDPALTPDDGMLGVELGRLITPVSQADQ
jgi:hypothetical protein